ncbi:hypothetical protein BJ165DRAFT_1534383 [Panaeolus papilionaceus]|nr:hypothetical protein BJ165DRAFT_1534383 [Panaeolus papilionaceus]
MRRWIAPFLLISSRSPHYNPGLLDTTPSSYSRMMWKIEDVSSAQSYQVLDLNVVYGEKWAGCLDRCSTSMFAFQVSNYA